MMILLSVFGFIGRLSFSFFSELIDGARPAACWIWRRRPDHCGKANTTMPCCLACRRSG